MFNCRSRKTHWMNLLKIFLILYQVQERTGRESKVQVLKFALIVFHANLAIITSRNGLEFLTWIHTWFFFFFLASRSSSVVNPDLNSLVSAVTFGRGMFDDTCTRVCFEAKWPTQLELICFLISVFITWNDKEYHLSFWMGCKCIVRLPPSISTGLPDNLPLPIFIKYTYWDLHTEKVWNSKIAWELSVLPNITKHGPSQVSRPDLLTWNPAH